MENVAAHVMATLLWGVAAGFVAVAVVGCRRTLVMESRAETDAVTARVSIIGSCVFFGIGVAALAGAVFLSL